MRLITLSMVNHCFIVEGNVFCDIIGEHNVFLSRLMSSLQHPELLVASYNANEDAPHDPDGVVLVWNSRFKKATPEYVFHCQVCQKCCICIYHI